MIRRASLCLVAFLQCFGSFFPDRASPGAVRILPCQTIMFPRRAEDMLCVLVPLNHRAFPRRTLFVPRQNPDKSEWHSVRCRRYADLIFPHGLPWYETTTCLCVSLQE